MGTHEQEPLINFGELVEPLSSEDFAARLARCCGREPLVIASPDGRAIQRVAWCTGAAQGYLESAASLGLDAYVSGEISEQTFHMARELGIHYFAAGHHATERFGVQALGNHLAGQFSLEHQYIDILNPV
jgi:putative NIF3 family GTP cyclohydrolase 1 type 2